jgi:hypothetical protein
MNDTQLLANCPEYLSIGSMLKATPRMEGDKRFIYIEASNEVEDQQDETVLQKALKDSSDWFLQYGNLDIDHYTLIGKPNPGKNATATTPAIPGHPGIPGCELFEIGRPVDVRFEGKKTFVKGLVCTGEGLASEKANEFWSSLTDISPPSRWYPSVGGHVMDRAIEIDPSTKTRKAYVTKVRWSNIGFSKTPVNQAVPTVATIPFGVLAKSWGALGIDFVKALEASYATDAVGKTGGAALGMQSLDIGRPANYLAFRETLAAFMKGRGEEVTRPNEQQLRRLVHACSTKFGLALSDAAEYVERFYRDLKTGLNKRRVSHE